MKPVKYEDGTNSREVEDWEHGGIQTENSKRLNAIDRLANLHDLVSVCASSLIYEEHSSTQFQKQVGHVLFFYIAEEIKQIREELES